MSDRQIFPVEDIHDVFGGVTHGRPPRDDDPFPDPTATVYGIRPHRQRTPEEAEREHKLAMQLEQQWFRNPEILGRLREELEQAERPRTPDPVVPENLQIGWACTCCGRTDKITDVFPSKGNARMCGDCAFGVCDCDQDNGFTPGNPFEDYRHD
ncbi:hypothetical protein [Rhodococcus koreensis]